MKAAGSQRRQGLNMRLVVLIALVLAAASVTAGSFVSFNGKFHFTYPDTWQQVDYHTADYYLNQGRANDETLSYEAVFADTRAYKVFAGQYLILTVDTVDELSPTEIDSVLNVMSGDFDRSVVRVSPDSFLVQWDDKSIFYDSANQATAIISELTGGQDQPRYSLMAVRFHERGIANFYFYTPSDEFENALPDYRQMILSLSNENIEEALPVEKAKVAKVKASRNMWKYAALFGGLLAIVVVIFLAFRKKSGGRAA